MDTVVISWNPGEDTKKWNAFRKKLENIFLSIKTDSFKTDKKHIFFVTDKDKVDALIDTCSVLVCPEELDGKAVGTGTLKAWKKRAPEGFKVITVLDMSRYGGGKLKGLFDNGFLDALFQKDFTLKGLFQIIKASRTEAEAYAYYGLDGYVDKKTRKKKAAKEAVKEIDSPEEVVPKDNGTAMDNGAESVAPDPAKVEVKGEESGEQESVTENIKDAVENVPETPADIPPVKEAPSETEPAREDKTSNAAEESTEPSKEEPAETSDTAGTADRGTVPVTDMVSEDALSGSTPSDNVPSDGESNDVSGGTDASDVNKAEVVDFESHGKSSPDDEEEEVEEDALKIFTLPEDSLVTYLNECDSEAHSYVRPYPELTKTDRMLEELLDYYTVQNNTWIQNVNNNAQIRDQFEAELRQRIAGNDLDLTVSEREQVFDEFSRFMWRYDILEPYILDPDVSDIKVYDPWTVQIKVRGKKMAAPTTFRSNLHYRGFIGRIARKNHVDINNKGLARFADTLTYSEVRLRGNIATELLNCNGSPLIHMRKVNNTKFTTEKLIALKMMTPATAAYLVWCIRNGKSIVFCGKGSSGKTTITNWLIDFFPLWLSALCIQEIDELYSVTHPYIQFQQITSDIELLGDTEGKQKYTLRDLAINGLLTDIDAFLIGEIKGPEALQFTNSANTGNQCLCTVHAEHEREALPQIADYSKFGSDYSRADLLKRLTSIDVVVFMQDFQVKSISEVVGWDEDRQDIVYRSVPIVVPEKIGVEEKHKIMGAERRLFVAA